MDGLRLSGKHVLLLLLYAPGKTGELNEAISGRTRITKMLFLFDREIKSEFSKDVEFHSMPEFYPWKFGPFSKDVYEDIVFFCNNDFVVSRPVDERISNAAVYELEDWYDDYLLAGEKQFLQFPYNEECFQLTDKGVTFTKEKIWNKLSENQWRIMARFKSNLVAASLDAILRYVYTKYPGLTGKSGIKEDIIG